MEQKKRNTRLTVADLGAKLDRIEALTLIGVKNVLDIDEAALFTGYSKGHLYRLTSTKQIPHFKKDRKVVFVKSELEAWLTENPVKTGAQIDREATTYCATH